MEFDARAGMLLDGPVGRLALAMLALEADGGAYLEMRFDLDRLSDPVGFRSDLAAACRDQGPTIAARARSDQVEVLRLIGETVQSYPYGFAAQGHTQMPVLEQCTDLLVPLARSLAREPSLDWWWSRVGAEQRVTETVEGTLIDQVHPEYDTGYAWWVAPRTRRTVHTTRALPAPAGSVAAVCAEDLCTEQPRTVGFRPPAGPVLEIGCADDWVRLVTRRPHRWDDSARQWAQFTGHHGPWTGPDWDVVASEVAGVHLSFAAYLSFAYRPLPLQDGRWTLLTGWDPDATVWWVPDLLPYSWPASSHAR